DCGGYDAEDFCRRMDEELFPLLDGTPASGPGGYYLSARFRTDFESAVLHAVNGGGQNQARAILTGALTGAQTGLSGIPRRFIVGLEKADDLGKLAADLTAKSGDP
ncbi:MAG: ADP-ribosylglycohydrolase family protein, partial [Desulfobacterales bacterium]